MTDAKQVLASWRVKGKSDPLLGNLAGGSVIRAINTEQTLEASIGLGYFLQTTRSHLESLILGFSTNIRRASSEQWCSRVSREEAFDSLGPFLGGLHRISSAQLASLDSIRDRLIDFRWNPRLTSTGQDYQVLK